MLCPYRRIIDLEYAIALRATRAAYCQRLSTTGCSAELFGMSSSAFRERTGVVAGGSPAFSYYSFHCDV